MAELPPLYASDFDAFFAAVHGQQPFPWQTRLALRLAGGEGWPHVLDLPTGTGKTAVLDIALFHLALEAGKPRTAPLRIVYVVDRRTIVDQAHRRAATIRNAILEGGDPVLASVRERLAGYCRDGVPLRVALLRGAIARSDLWARSPDQPLVAVSTVDQVGSRLLFRGYGVSDSMKPIHAGLLGNDVLYLLDEVHLSEPFRQTLAAIGGRYRCAPAPGREHSWSDRWLANPFEVVEMSATPGATRDRTMPFGLDGDDHAHPLLSQRLSARKATTLASTNARGFVAEVEKHVKPMVAAPGATVAVVVNRIASAREVFTRLKGSLHGATVHLVTGRMRPLDRDKLEEGLLQRIRAGRTRDEQQAPVVVVATQCIEAGADFDFDGLVTECASLDALRQRFGRLDRLGQSEREARAVVVARIDSLEDDPVYGEALGATWAWLEGACAAGNGKIDFGLRGLELPQHLGALLAPKPNAPVLLPSHLDAWVQTSPRPLPDPDVALWLHGPERGVADVQVVWRADLSIEALQRAHADSDNGATRDMVLGAVQAMPPASGEAMSVPFAAARQWLAGRPEPDVSDVEGAREPSTDDRPDGLDENTRPAILWRGEASEVVVASRIWSDTTRLLAPGDTIVVPASYGGIASGTWAPAASNPIDDLAEIAIMKQRARGVLRLHPKVIEGLFGSPAASAWPKPQSLESEDVDDRRRVDEWLHALVADDLRAEVQELLDVLRAPTARLRVERLPGEVEGASTEYFVVTARDRVASDEDEVSSEDDRGSFTGVEVRLEAHLGGVREVVGVLAAGLGLPASVVADIQLAGRWHDVGKIDPRFQRLLHGGSEFKALVQDAPLAKSALPTNDWRIRQRAQDRSGYPAGMRHEVMSLALIGNASAELAALANDWELVQHLVASHHGRCRPFAPWVADPRPVEMQWELDGIAITGSSEHDLARLDSGVAERFWLLIRRYGWWGLAWLETIVRLGDHRRSEEEQRVRWGSS